MAPEGFHDGLADGEAGVKGRVRVLKHYLHLATELFALGVGEFVKAGSVVLYGTGTAFDKLQDGTAKGAFATARLTDKTEGFAPVDIKREAVDGIERLEYTAEDILFEGIGDLQVAHPQQRRW